LLDPPEPTTFPARLPLATGSDGRTTSVRRPSTSARRRFPDQPWQGSCCIYQGDELGLHRRDPPRAEMQDPFGIRGYPLVLVAMVAPHPMPWTIEGDQAGFTTAPEALVPLPREHRRIGVEAQERDPSHC